MIGNKSRDRSADPHLDEFQGQSIGVVQVGEASPCARAAQHGLRFARKCPSILRAGPCGCCEVVDVDRKMDGADIARPRPQAGALNRLQVLQKLDTVTASTKHRCEDVRAMYAGHFGREITGQLKPSLHLELENTGPKPYRRLEIGDSNAGVRDALDVESHAAQHSRPYCCRAWGSMESCGRCSL
jgi:hypothetical protein